MLNYSVIWEGVSILELIVYPSKEVKVTSKNDFLMGFRPVVYAEVFHFLQNLRTHLRIQFHH